MVPYHTSLSAWIEDTSSLRKRQANNWDAFFIIGRWSWVMCIAVVFASAAIFRVQARKRIQQDPELAEGYRKITMGFLAWANIPWIVMGAGCFLGGVPSVFHFFRPRDGDPFVLAFFA